MYKIDKIVMSLVLGTSLLFAGNLPNSRESSFMESYSSSEVTIKATGVGEGVEASNNDLLKSAIYFVLNGGTDPLLASSESKSKFKILEEKFFEMDNIRKFISWEAQKVSGQKKIKIDGEKVLKRTKMVRVNKKALTEYLSTNGVIMSQDALADAVGLPFIMVIPEVAKGKTPLEVLDANPLAKHAAATIESYLTARQYDVVVPRASEQLNDVAQMSAEIKGAEEGVAYQIALSLGSDVYIVYAGRVQDGKASVSVKAYETTTARLLGTETGYSKTRPGANMEPLVEEAIGDAISKVLQRVTNYWMKDVKVGIQYKMIFKMTGEFDEDETEEIQEKISDLFDDVFDRSKENVITDKTMDYLVWAKKDDFKKASKIYRYFKKKMKKTAKIRKININKKLIIMSVDNL
jgi:hypothetical protein